MKTWKELFGDKKVAIEVNSGEEEVFVREYFDFEIKTSLLVRTEPIALTQNYQSPSGMIYEDSWCDSPFYKRQGYSIINFDEFKFLLNKEEINPSLGVIPKKFWIMTRKKELARAIHEYMSTNTPCDKLTEWVNELKELNDVQL